MSYEDQPYSELSISELRTEIDFCDRAIINYLQKRQQLSKEIGRQRQAAGGSRVDPRRENQIYEQYSRLGDVGHRMAALVLEMGRGQDVSIQELMSELKQGNVTLDDVLDTLGARLWPIETEALTPATPARSSEVTRIPVDPNHGYWVDALLDSGSITDEQYDLIFDTIEEGGKARAAKLQTPDKSD